MAGGPLVALVVERMARTPFQARLEISQTGITKTNTTTSELTITETGAINGQDLELTYNTTSDGVLHRSRLVIVGDSVYIRLEDGPWQVSTRARPAFPIETLMRSIRHTLNGDQIADIGVEELQGRTVHHMVSTGPVTFDDPGLGLTVYDTFELWVLPDGSPVLRREAVRSSKDGITWTGTTEVRFTDFGRPIEIVAPELSASPSPSARR